MIGLGIDIVDINRIRHWLSVEGLPERFFNKAELEDAHKKGKTVALSLAARFAAKEAFGKALGSGLQGIKLKDICVINDERGKPELEVFDSALQAFKESGGERIHLSLSHEKNTAVAVVVIE